MRRFFHAVFIVLLSICAVVCIFTGCGEDGGQPAGPEGGGPPVTTVDTIPPAGILTLIATSPGAGSLALQWVSPGDDGWEGTAASYDIRFSRTPIDESTWNAADRYTDAPKPLKVGTIQVCRVNGLDSKTKYWFRAKSLDEAGNESGLSNLTSGTTLQELIPPAAISDLEATALDDTTFLLTWTATGDDGPATGAAASYDVRYKYALPVTEINWQGASQVAGEPAPKPAGEPESLLVVVDTEGGNHGFAVKAADEVPNWSDLSNVCMTLGINEFLTAYPGAVSAGQNISIVYRSTGGGKRLRLEMHPGYAGYDCGSHRYTLYDGRPPAGVYTLVYDFTDPVTHEYLQTDFYFLYLCIDGQNTGTYRVQFTNS